MNGRGSRERRREAVRAARDAAYRSKGAPYCDSENPFPEGAQRRRFERAYVDWQRSYWRMEDRKRELESVYGCFETEETR